MRKRVVDAVDAKGKKINAVAQKLLLLLDKIEHRHGQHVEGREPIRGGKVVFWRNRRGGIKFRAPRGIEAEARVIPNRRGLTTTKRNIGKMEAFLEKEESLLEFLWISRKTWR